MKKVQAGRVEKPRAANGHTYGANGNSSFNSSHTNGTLNRSATSSFQNGVQAQDPYNDNDRMDLGDSFAGDDFGGQQQQQYYADDGGDNEYEA